MKQVQAIVLYKVDRIFLSTVDALETARMLERQGVSFHSIEETLGTQSVIGRFLLTLTAALAEMKKRLTGEKIKPANIHNRSR